MLMSNRTISSAYMANSNWQTLDLQNSSRDNKRFLGNTLKAEHKATVSKEICSQISGLSNDHEQALQSLIKGDRNVVLVQLYPRPSTHGRLDVFSP